MKKAFFSSCCLILPVLFFTPSCSLKKLAMNQVANALTGSGSSTVFTGDNDPELVGDALPFAIKMYESLLAANPRHQGLRLQTGSLYVMYANAFLQTPATMLPEEEYKKQEFTYKRAKNLYLRGRDIILACLEDKYPGLRADLQKRKYDQALERTTRKDAPLLYWAGAGWLGAYAIDPFDMDLGVTLPAAAALIERVYRLDPDYAVGAIHEFYILYYGSLPEYMGGSLKKAREHFGRALEISRGRSATPYLSLATSVTVKEQNLAEYKDLLNKALAIDPEAAPENRLVNVLNQRKAQWLLEHADDFFLADEEPEAQPEEK
ncbi:MAG: TRAP transporter TatT component family protein [Acidobacteria bacterium]|jgi:predicted anti-sigma-YlaC factor YlaD|nr:TRAP transporter TatT component family protein [Acidobacteriota bacterium]